MAIPSLAERQRSVEIMMIRLMDALRSTQPKVLKSGDISQAQMVRVEKAAGSDALQSSVIPSVSEDEWGRFLLAVARELEIVEIRDGRMSPSLKACDVYFAKDAEERLEAMREAWVKTPYFNEFMYLPDLEVNQTRGTTRKSGGADCVPGAPEIRRVRKALLARIESFEEGKWLGTKAFLNKIEAESPDIMLSDQTHPFAHTPDYIGIRFKGEPEELHREGHWQDVEGALLREMLALPLFVLGWVDYDFSSKQARIRLAEGETEELGGGDKPLMIQPNYDVMALIPEMTIPQLWRVARLTAVTSFAQAAHFRLEEPWIISAVNVGNDVPTLIAELDGMSKTPLPQNVSYSMEEWGRRAQRITIWLDAAFIESEGIEDAAERLIERGSSGFESIDEKHAVVAMSALSKLKEDLPPRAVDLDYSRALPPVLEAKSSGVVTLDHEGAHFRARQAVSRFADEIGIDRYQVTAKSLGRSAENGMGVEAVVAAFRALCARVLPPLFEAKVRTWLSNDVEAAMSSPIVLRLNDSRVAGLLSKSPEVDDIFGDPLSLQAFSVEADKETEIQSLLSELGIEQVAELDSHSQSSRGDFAHSYRAPASGLEGFSPVSFERAYERGVVEALRYAMPYRPSLTLQCSGSKLNEATLVTPLALWLDGDDGVLEIDCRYLHRVELVRLSTIQRLEAAQ